MDKALTIVFAAFFETVEPCNVTKSQLFRSTNLSHVASSLLFSVNKIIITAKKWQKSDFKREIGRNSGQFTDRKYHVHPQRPPELQSEVRFCCNSQKKVCCGATPSVSATRFGLFTIRNCDVVGFSRGFLVAFELEGLEFHQKQQNLRKRSEKVEKVEKLVGNVAFLQELS
jgi:hypothetical protein